MSTARMPLVHGLVGFLNLLLLPLLIGGWFWAASVIGMVTTTVGLLILILLVLFMILSVILFVQYYRRPHKASVLEIILLWAGLINALIGLPLLLMILL